MNITILAFGIAKDIVGSRSVQMEIPADSSLADLRALLNRRYPALRDIAVYRIAVNDEYAIDNLLLQAGDEIAIIPPVSGG